MTTTTSNFNNEQSDNNFKWKTKYLTLFSDTQLKGGHFFCLVYDSDHKENLEDSGHDQYYDNVSGNGIFIANDRVYIRHGS